MARKSINKNSSTKIKIHFIGIGGIGMSALARWTKAQGATVSGSDIAESKLISDLKKEGVKVTIGHKKESIKKDFDIVIYNQAINAKNPEILAAKQFKIITKSYPEAIGELTHIYKTVAIAGSHGKSTTTALASLVLTKAKFDPTIIVGTKLRELANSNFRNGKGEWLVLEADEYGRAFLNYSPFAAIITNIDREHLDCYKDLADIKKTFLGFISNIQPGGILIVNKEDKNLFSLKNKIEKIAQKNNFGVTWYGLAQSKQVNVLKRSLKISGNHNISNALGVLALAKFLKIKETEAIKALSHYRGAWRRMEYRGQFEIRNSSLSSIRNSKLNLSGQAKLPASFKIQNSKFKISAAVYDDYAHHPTEIKATLQGLKAKYPKEEIICVFQPHQTKRLSLLFKEFSSAFDLADKVIITDVYEVAGRDGKNKNVTTSAELAGALKKRNKALDVYHLKNLNELPRLIKEIVSSPAVIVMMGAGDIVKYTDSLITTH